mmetsp:Transcript_40413/g.99957  ORF Transcript_40413/g.99957 Transcript_40413/m.99957 type:complete len:137 (+) Transcript_40413:215-625(+)
MHNKVLYITYPDTHPTTLNGWTEEWWCENLLIPAMIEEDLEYAIFDNATPHRRRILRALFAVYGLAVYFLPPYSPWFQPIEKMFLGVHMKCNMDVERTRSSFIRHVVACLRGMPAEEVDGCWGLDVDWFYFVCLFI